MDFMQILEVKISFRNKIAIIEYLDEAYPTKPLLPNNALKRAKVREIAELIASGIQPLQNLATLYEHSDDENERTKWAQHWIQRGLTGICTLVVLKSVIIVKWIKLIRVDLFLALEKILVECSGKYCVGDEISMADCCLIPQIANAHIFKVELTPWPTITRLESRLSQLPAFKRAHPSNQPDFPSSE